MPKSRKRVLLSLRVFCCSVRFIRSSLSGSVTLQTKEMGNLPFIYSLQRRSNNHNNLFESRAGQVSSIESSCPRTWYLHLKWTLQIVYFLLQAVPFTYAVGSDRQNKENKNKAPASAWVCKSKREIMVDMKSEKKISASVAVTYLNSQKTENARTVEPNTVSTEEQDSL